MNARQKQFVEEYLRNGFNATQAYQSAYPNATHKTAGANGHSLLNKTEIKEAIEKGQKKTLDKLEIKREDIVEKLLRIQETTEGKNPHASLKALEMLSKLLGLNAPEKTENRIIGDIDITKLFGFEE